MKKKSIAIIPARGGSKRIPGKNIKKFLGKPIIAYTIEATLRSKCFDEVMVSTDDEQIAEIARKYGAQVPYMRSQKTASDTATQADVLKEVFKEYKKIGRTFDYLCMLYATAPLITARKICQGKKLLLQFRADAVIPVVKFDFPVQRAFKIVGNRLKMMYPENLYVNSQQFAPAYKDSGLFVWAKVTSFLRSGHLMTDHTIAMEVGELEAQDIDTLEDWRLAELKYKSMTFRAKSSPE